MKVNFNVELKTLEGEVINAKKQYLVLEADRTTLVKNDLGEELVIVKDDKPLTAKQIVVNSLLAGQKEKEPDGEEMLKRYRLASKVSNSDKEIEINLDDVERIRKTVTKQQNILIYGQIYDLLDKPETPKENK